jgi:hypothetical protein
MSNLNAKSILENWKKLKGIKEAAKDFSVEDMYAKLMDHWKRNPPNAQTGHAKEYYSALKKVKIKSLSDKDKSLIKELWSMYGARLGESVSESELSREVKDKIMANNDKMSDLKANGGSQEEIDALEKENDELNGGNDTSEAREYSPEEARLKQEIINLTGEIRKTRRKISGAADHRRNEIAKFKGRKRHLSPEELKKAKEALKRGSETDAEYEKHAKADIAKWREEKSKLEDKLKKMRGGSVSEDAELPAKFMIAMGKLANKPVAKQVEVLTYGIRNLMQVMAEKPSNKVDLKVFAAHLLGTVTHGVEGIEQSDTEDGE